MSRACQTNGLDRADGLKLEAAYRDDAHASAIITRAGSAVLVGSPPHSHARGQLVGCTRGVVAIGTKRGTWVVPARHAIWLPPHHEHSSGTTRGPFTGWSVYIATALCVVLPTEPCVLEIPPLAWELVARSAQWSVDGLGPAETRLAAALVDELGGLRAQPLGLALPRDVNAARVAHALLDHPADRRRLETWAKWAGLSPRTLSRRFAEETGMSFTHWRQRATLLRAFELLAAHTSVTTTAIELGYDSVSAFIALFRRTFGTTPAAYFAR